jgi:hypothetical protein
MVQANPALPYGLRDVRLYPLAADWSLGTGVDLPVARVFTFSDTEAFTELTGDDTTQASHGAGPVVEWELEAGGISLAAYQVMAGGAIVRTGVTPNIKDTFTKLTTDSRPYFQVEGRAISDSGGDVHTIVYRCKADSNLEGTFEGGNFFLTKGKGKGYGDNVGASPTFKLYQFVQNETGVAIP